MIVFEIASYICIVICILLIIKKIWCNINVNIINKKATKIFYYFSMSLLCMGATDIDTLLTGQLFKRYPDKDSITGYSTKDMLITFFGNFRKSEDNFIYLDRLYYVPTQEILKIISNKEELSEETLIKYMCLYFQLDSVTKKIQFWSGQYRFDDIRFQDSISSLRLFRRIINTIYKECTLKGESLNPICIEFSLYYDLLMNQMENNNGSK